MAVTAPTALADFSGFLDRDQSAPIFERAARVSVAQQLARQVPVSTRGNSIPVVTGKMSAGWVAEGAQKPASKGAVSLKTMDAKKIAAIAVVSKEVLRENPANYMSLIREQIAEAFALAFDAAALHGTNSPFSTYIDQTTKSVELGTAAASAGGILNDINAGLSLLVEDGKRLNGFAFDIVAEPLFNAAFDTTGRPLWIDPPTVETSSAVRSGRVLGRPAFMGEGVSATTAAIGYGGDWSQAVWGVASGLSYQISTEASVTIDDTLVSLWEQNLVAVLAEAEYGWLVNDTAAFVKYANAT